ncbi:Nict2, partial [Symbiodinium necroappetens]
AADLKIRSRIVKARRVFQELDADGSGSISVEEIREHASTPAVLEFFESVDVHPEEAQHLIEVLDMKDDGNIGFEDFLEIAVRLNGMPKASDLLMLYHEVKRFHVHSAAEMNRIKIALGLEPGPPALSSDGSIT